MSGYVTGKIFEAGGKSFGYGFVTGVVAGIAVAWSIYYPDKRKVKNMLWNAGYSTAADLVVNILYDVLESSDGEETTTASHVANAIETFAWTYYYEVQEFTSFEYWSPKALSYNFFGQSTSFQLYSTIVDEWYNAINVNYFGTTVGEAEVSLQESTANLLEGIVDNLAGLLVEQVSLYATDLASWVLTNNRWAIEDALAKVPFIQNLPPQTRGRMARKLGTIILNHYDIGLTDLIINTVTPHVADIADLFGVNMDRLIKKISTRN